MGRQDMTDEYIEGVLREHFKAEVLALPTSNDPWKWLESRLDSPPRHPGFGGILSALTGRMSAMPKPLVAAISVVVIVAGAAMWAIASGPGYGEHLDPDSSKDTADIVTAVEEAVSATAGAGRLTADEVRRIVEASTANRVTAADVQGIVGASKGEQLTSADVQKMLIESAAGQVTAADVQRIVEVLSTNQVTAEDVQKAMMESTGGQLTAADVQKIVDASANQVTAADVQRLINASVSDAVQSAEKATAAAEAARKAAESASAALSAPTPVTQLALARLPSLTAESSSQSSSQGAAAAQQSSQSSSQSAPVAQRAADTGWNLVILPKPVFSPSATTFRDYQRSRFASTSEDSVSTFSLDTDRTSFQLALNWARSGHEVDPDSVRAEEWINSFDYGYAPPVHRDSFAITTDVLMHPLNSRMHLVRLGFQAPELQDDTPLNVTLVLDASGSMSDGNRVAIAREAAESIRRSLRSRDRIGVVHFTTDVIRDLTVRHTDPGDRDVRRSIDRLAPHNSTNVQAGLDLGVKLADRARRERPDAYNYIILMSDGVANVDATDPFAILESAYDADSGNPLRLITIGVGISNYNDYLLEQLAQHGNGWYRYLSDVLQARATFSRESWLALSVPFADQTRAQVTWNEDVVESWRMIGYENRVTSDESFVEDRKEFAEIPAGAATTVFYEVRVHDDVWRRPSETVDLGDVQLGWVTPMSGLSNRQSAAMTSRLDGELGTTEDALLEFGAVVALASDRYGSLPYLDGEGTGDVRRDLWALSDQLQPLGQQLGHLDSYQDFAFLMDQITASMPRDIDRGTGYSR